MRPIGTWGGGVGFSLALLYLVVVACTDPAPDVARIRQLYGDGDAIAAQEAARLNLAWTERHASQDSLEVAAALDVLIETLWEGDRESLREALDAARRSLEIKRRHVSRNATACGASLYHIGVILTGLGDWPQAKVALEQALEIQHDGPSDALSDTLVVLANLEAQMGDYAAAAVDYEEALEILLATRGEDDLDLAYARSMYANLLAETGDYDAAIAAHEQALAARLKAHGRLHPRVAGSFNNLGLVHLAAGDPEPALACMREALAIRETILPPRKALLASTRANVAAILDALGRFEEGDTLLDQGVADLVAAVGRDHPDVAELIAAQAMRANRNGDRRRALDLYGEALDIRQTALGPTHPDVAVTLVALAAIQAADGQRDLALRMSLRAEEIGRESLTLANRMLSERQALRYAEVRASGLDLAIALLGEKRDEASIATVWAAVMNARANVLDEMVARRRVGAESSDPQLARAWGELASARERYSRAAIEALRANDPGDHDRRLEEAQRERDAAERRLARTSATFRESREKSQLGLAEVARALPAATALLAYIVHEDSTVEPPRSRYTAFLLPDRDRTAVAIPLRTVEEIDRAVGDYRRAIDVHGDLPGVRAAGDAVRRLVWDPVEPLLPRETRLLLVVPDGSLHLVNLSTLATGANRFLIDTAPMIHHLSAERDTLNGSDVDSGEGLLALGDPAFESLATGDETTSGHVLRTSLRTCQGLRRRGFASLPGTGREIEEIVDLWSRSHRGASLRLTGGDATETAFKAHAAGKRVLHLATHGFAIDSRCLDRGLATRGVGALSPPRDETDPSRHGPQPSVRSGLILAAPTGNGADDGVLTAEEIAALDLSGVEWTVLSACESGVGPVQTGEGVMGLRRAFQAAGARTVITSLWSVDDKATLEWVRLLYSGRLEGMSTAAAVHHATSKVLQERRDLGDSEHPFFWGAFVATGNWR